MRLEIRASKAGTLSCEAWARNPARRDGGACIRVARALQRPQKRAHAFQTTVEFLHRSCIRNPNVVASAETLARNRGHMGFAQKLACEVGRRLHSAPAKVR